MLLKKWTKLGSFLFCQNSFNYSFLYHEQINLEKNLNKANELFKSINIEDYETKVTDDIRKMEQENRRKLELFDAETKEVVKRYLS